MDNFDDKYKKKNPFSVPEGYFDGLTDRVMNHLEEEPRKAPRVTLRRVVRLGLSVAAIVSLVLLTIPSMMPRFADQGQLSWSDSENAMQRQEMDEDIFDSQFNPTTEEIIEYLAMEVNEVEWLYAGIY